MKREKNRIYWRTFLHFRQLGSFFVHPTLKLPSVRGNYFIRKWKDSHCPISGPSYLTLLQHWFILPSMIAVILHIRLLAGVLKTKIRYYPCFSLHRHWGVVIGRMRQEGGVLYWLAGWLCWVYLYINNTKCKWQSSSATGSQHYYNYLGRVRSGSDRPVRQTQNTATLTLNKFSNIALSTNLCIFCNG